MNPIMPDWAAVMMLVVSVMLTQCLANYTTQKAQQFLANYTTQEAQQLLNDLNINSERRHGCATPIKCASTGDEDVYNMTEPGIRCCYDCTDCHGDRCYRGWQCCRDTGGGHNTLTDDSFLYYDDVPEEYLTCEDLFNYEKLMGTDIDFETAIDESAFDTYDDRDPISYQMVSACPRHFNDTQIKAACENATRLGDIIDLIPVISTDKLQLFKNRHCAKCHNANVTPLKLLLSAQRVHYKYIFISMIETIHDLRTFSVPIQLSKSAKMRIRLHASVWYSEPDIPGAQTIPPCNIHVQAWENDCVNDTSLDNEALRRACQLLYLPVLVKSAYFLPHLSKNLACAYCKNRYAVTGPFTQMDHGYSGALPLLCSSEMDPGPNIVLNIQPAFAESNASSNTAGNVLLLADNQHDHDCQSGYFWDVISSQCRRILCPRRHYIYQSKCEPLFKESNRHSYYVKIKASPKDKPAALDTELLALQDHLVNTIKKETGMGICFKDILVHTESEHTYSYAVYEFALNPVSRMLYTDALEKIKFIFSPALNKLLATATHFRKFNLDIGDILYYDRSLTFSSPIDSIDGTILIKLTPRDYTTSILKGCGGLIDVSWQDYCYRMRLEPNEYTLDHVKSTPRQAFRLKINATGDLVYRDNYDILLDGTARICIGDYMRSRNYSTLPPTVAKDTNGSSITYIGVFSVVVVAVLLPLLARLTVIFCRRHTFRPCHCECSD